MPREPTAKRAKSDAGPRPNEGSNRGAPVRKLEGTLSWARKGGLAKNLPENVAKNHSENVANHGESMRIIANLWESLPFLGNPCNFLGSLANLLEPQPILGNPCKSLAILGDRCKSLGIFAKPKESFGILANPSDSVQFFGNPCKSGPHPKGGAASREPQKKQRSRGGRKE